MIQAVRVTHYRTGDGTVFTSRDDAERHEIKCKIMEILRQTIDRNQVSAEELELVAARLMAKTSPVIILRKSDRREEE